MTNTEETPEASFAARFAAELVAAAAPEVKPPEVKPPHDPRKLVGKIARSNLIMSMAQPSQWVLIHETGRIGLNYYLADFSGYDTREKAHIYPLQEAFDNTSTSSIELEFVVGPEPLPDGKKSLLSNWFRPEFVELLMTTPNNPLLRGHMMKRLKKMPPIEADTFEKLRDWVELNCEFAGQVKQLNSAYQPINTGTPPTRAQAAGQSIEVEWYGSEREYGRCDYSVRRSGRGTNTVSLETIKHLIDDNPDEDIDGLLENIRSRFVDDGDYEFDDYGDYDYDDHESNDSDDFELSIRNVRTTKDQILALLAMHAPNHLRILNGEEVEEE
jgi:hypothetical protein